MTSPVETIDGQSSAEAAAKQMAATRIEHLVVIDGGGHVVGVISDRDLRAAQPSLLLVKDPEMRKKALAVMRVTDLMAEDPHIVRPDQPVKDVLRAMLRQHIGCVPVVDGEGVPVGITTAGDVTKLALSMLDRFG